MVVYKQKGILNTISCAFWTFLDLKAASVFHHKRKALFIHKN